MSRSGALPRTGGEDAYIAAAYGTPAGINVVDIRSSKTGMLLTGVTWSEYDLISRQEPEEWSVEGQPYKASEMRHPNKVGLTMHTSFRQGDVLLHFIGELPASCSLLAKGERIVLARGVATGHDHAIPQHAESYTDADGVIVLAGDGAVLEHQEHAPIPLAAGAYRVVRQREYSPAAVRNVAD